ncbi:MAG: hypothetical protein SWH61_02795 [Thermodesulfobacteriota bacterium]|nr:hypothetical protein [Thermodesulfobacteriota bacterium]
MNGRAVQEAQKKTWTRIIMAGVVVVGFTLLMIAPAQFKITAARNEIKAMHAIKEKQQAMYPVYANFSNTDKQLTSMYKALQNTADVPTLPATGIKSLPGAFRKITEAAGLTLDTCVPDIRSIEKGAPAVGVDLTLNGQFVHLPVLLSMFEADKRIRSITQLQIEAGPQLTYKIGLLISMTVSTNGKLET